MDVAFRILGQEDANDYRQLRLISYQEAAEAFSESYEDEKEKELQAFEAELIIKGEPAEWFVLGAFVDEKLIGFVKFRRDQRSKARHKSMVHAMYVDPAYRGHGIGRRIIEDLLQRVRQQEGLEQIHLWVLHANGKSAAPFYASLGFVRQGPLVKKDLKIGQLYIDAEYMVMYLD